MIVFLAARSHMAVEGLRFSATNLGTPIAAALYFVPVTYDHDVWNDIIVIFIRVIFKVKVFDKNKT